jgi:hypothetical protein
MLTCCGKDIKAYRILGTYISISGDEEEADIDNPLFLRFGSIFKPQAHIECPQCGKIHIYSVNAPILEDMERLDNLDLWEKAVKIRDKLSKKS